jgi:CRISPR-associated protein Csm1
MKQMEKNDLLFPSCRVALAAFIHDIGKFAERAKINVDNEILENNKQLYCKKQSIGKSEKDFYYSHIHAAYTAIAVDLLEQKLPELIGDDIAPFADWSSKKVDDSLINAASKHHNPKTFLQWVIATADRVASGFEREEFEQYNQAEEKTETGKDHYTARQLTLFEQISLNRNRDKGKKSSYEYRYPLQSLSPKAIFPIKAEGYEHNNKEQAQSEYKTLWDKFINCLGNSKNGIPYSHRENLSLWLDHFNSLYCVTTGAIPSATAFGAVPDVSLYDHSICTAAFAVSLWRYHSERGDNPESTAKAMQNRSKDWDIKKFLLIQGDFFGIQEFIFAQGGETQKKAAKLLRGRSFYVSLLTECAALKILDELGLPSTSQIINIAGKFLIVAPNTDETIKKLKEIQKEFDNWFLKRTWGQSGVGIIWQSASCNDFLESRFTDLQDKLFKQLDIVKYQRFSLCSNSNQAVFSDFLNQFEYGVCEIDGRSPATKKIDEDEIWVSDLAYDQIRIGAFLTKFKRLLITKKSLNHNTLGISIFGYSINFTKSEDISGKFGREAKNGNLLRTWDFALPNSDIEPLWNGYARRNINAWIPYFDNKTEQDKALGKYAGIEEEIEEKKPKTLNHIACDDKMLNDDKKWEGIAALTTFKGDIDNLGLIFQDGLGTNKTFAKMATLSRQVNNFFTVYLPWLCRTDDEFKNTYTVFAGGDDFFMIGSWLSQIKLAKKLKEAFSHYVAGNNEIHFSAGLSTTKPGVPITFMAELAEIGLEESKKFKKKTEEQPSKNAVTCFNQTMSWNEFDHLLAKQQELSEYTKKLKLSTGYVYGLLNLIDMSEKIKQNPENALWYSYFAYRTRRMLEKKMEVKKDEILSLQLNLTEMIVHNGIEKHEGNYRVVLFTHLYQQRR